MHPLQHQAAESPYLIRPGTAPFRGQSVQLPQQRRNLPAIEDGIAIGVQRTEKRERRLVEIAKHRLPGEATRCPGHDLTTQFPAHLDMDHGTCYLRGVACSHGSAGRPFRQPGRRCLPRHWLTLAEQLRGQGSQRTPEGSCAYLWC